MKTKLTMVSVHFRGCRQTIFIELPVDKDGKVRADVLSMFKIEKGACFGLGG